MRWKGWSISNEDTRTPVPVPQPIETCNPSGGPDSSVKSDLEEMHSKSVSTGIRDTLPAVAFCDPRRSVLQSRVVSTQHQK